MSISKGIGKRFFDAINRRPGRLPRVSDNTVDWERYIENRKSSVRCKVEHPYRIVKSLFGFRKTVYRGLRKNLNRLHVLFASANLYMLARAGSSLRPAQGFCALRAGWCTNSRDFSPQFAPSLDIFFSFGCLSYFSCFNQCFLNCATIVADSAIEYYEICLPHTYILYSFALFFHPFLYILTLDSH